MGEKVERLIELASVTVLPHTRVTKSGNIVKVKGHTRKLRLGDKVNTPEGPGTIVGWEEMDSARIPGGKAPVVKLDGDSDEVTITMFPDQVSRRGGKKPADLQETLDKAIKEGKLPTAKSGKKPSQKDHETLKNEFQEAFSNLKAAGLEADADHPVAKRYRDASDAVNHANRKRDFAIASGLDRRKKSAVAKLNTMLNKSEPGDVSVGDKVQTFRFGEWKEDGEVIKVNRETVVYRNSFGQTARMPRKKVRRVG